MIKALTLDLDDTLWDIWATIERAEQRLHDWLAERHPAIPQAYTPLELRELTAAAAQRWPDLAHDRTQLRKKSFRLAAELTGSDNFCEHSAFEVFYAGRNDVLFYPDALPSLARLSTQFPLLALTNGNADLNQVGIAHHFVAVLASGELGYGKPGPRMFHAACEQLSLPAAAICHIGDDPELDIAGAAAVGMRTVWINRNGRAFPPDLPAPDSEISSLTELDTVLTRWTDV